MGHEEPDQRPRPAALRTAAPVSGGDPGKAQRPVCKGRAVLGGRHGLLRRGREKGRRCGRAQAVCRPGGLHHHPARQGVLRPPDGGVRQPGGGLERERENSGRHLRGGGGRGQHHLRLRGRLGFHLQGGGRGDHIRGKDPREQQPDHCHPGD